MYNAVISEFYKVQINGIDLPYVSYVTDNDFEVTTDLKAQDINAVVPFFQNVGTYQTNITGLMINNNVIAKEWVTKTLAHTLKGNSYIVSIYSPTYDDSGNFIYDDDGNITYDTSSPIIEETMIVKHSMVSLNPDSVISYKITLYPQKIYTTEV